MAKHLTIVTFIAAFSLLLGSSEALSDMDPFANPRPTYEFDWTFGTGDTIQVAGGEWYSQGLNSHIAQSTGEGSAYNDGNSSCYWSPLNSQTNGFSVSNDIGEWLDLIGTGKVAILSSIREDYGAAVHNSDIVGLWQTGSESIYITGSDLGTSQDVTSLETSLESDYDFDAENLNFQHYYAVQPYGGTYAPNTYITRNQDDEDTYATFGAIAQMSSGSLYAVKRSTKTWDGTGNGYTSADGWDLYTYLEGRSENMSTTYNGLTTFDGTNWYMPIYIDSGGGPVEYMQRLDLPYNEAGYPESSGAVIQWYDDYDLYLAGDIATNPGGYGASGRYVLERNTFLVASSRTRWAHAADVCYEARTYNPTYNADGPESPYEWLYDASGDMYVPTDGSGSPTDTEYDRAVKLIGCHPAFPDDDTATECEFDEDRSIWKNQNEGVVGRNLFVDSWRLAGLMLGLDFWNDDPDYVWSGEEGAVVERTVAEEFMNFGNMGRMPVWTWNGTTSQWELPDTFDIYGSPPSHAYTEVWGWADNIIDTPVAGYDALNRFMRYVFDIDALVVEDADGDGEFDVGDDYVLFSVVDDGLYSKYAPWGASSGSIDLCLDGQFFDGDTIFLYDGTSVTTFFDADLGIFFGEVSSAGEMAALWGGEYYYDIDALDIGIDIDIIPEPSTIFLMLGSASGLALAAGIMRRKLR